MALPSRLTPRLRSGWLLLAGLGIPLAADGGVAQERVVVTSEAACTTCRIEMQRIATVGEREDPGGVGPSQVLARDSRGRFFHSHRGSPGQLLVFGPDGHFLRAIGRRGDGPGEFRAISRVIVGRGDTLFVFDGAARRLTVLSPALELVRTQRMPVSAGSASTLIRPNGEIVVSADVRSPDRVGYPLHLVDGEGSIVRSFGAVRPVLRPGVAYSMYRALAWDRSGDVWAAQKNRYLVELWDLSGQLHRVLERDARWFRPWETDPPISPDHAPDPRLQAIEIDSAGRLWILAMVADPHYRDALIRRDGPRGPRYEFTEQDRVFDSIIEVIDPVSGRLLSSLRVPQVLHNFAGPGLVFGSREDADGMPFLDVWRVHLQQRD